MPSSSFYTLSTPTIQEVTSVQAQLDQAQTLVNIVNGYLNEPTNAQTVNYTLQLTDRGKLVAMNVGSVNTLTVPPESSVSWPDGTWINLARLGAGKTTVVAGSGVTVNTALGMSLRAQYSGGSLIKIGTDTWLLVGDLDT